MRLGCNTQVVERVSEVLIPEPLRQDQSRLRESQRVVAIHLTLLVWCPPFAVLTTALSATTSGYILFWAGPLVIANLVLLRVTKAPTLCGNGLCLIAWIVFTSLALITGGLHSPITPWYACLPAFALMLSGTLSGVLWTVASALAVTGLVAVRHFDWLPVSELTPHADTVLSFTGFLAFLSVVFVSAWLARDVENRAQKQLREANKYLAVEATTDALTAIPNRRYFDRISEQEWKRHERTHLPLSVVIFDVDYFKHFNDAMGHAAGDRCLQIIAQAVHGQLRRPGDFVARYGGEEFVAVLPNTGDRDAARIAEQIRTAIRSLQIPHPDSPLSPYVTVSVGSGTIVPEMGDSYREFLREVDRALYRAKACGRDRGVHVAAALADID